MKLSQYFKIHTGTVARHRYIFRSDPAAFALSGGTITVSIELGFADMSFHRGLIENLVHALDGFYRKNRLIWFPFWPEVSSTGFLRQNPSSRACR